MKCPATSNALPALAAVFLLIASSGCDRDTVKVYKVDSQESAAPAPVATPASPSANDMASMADQIPAPDNSHLPKLAYTLPAGWQEKPASQFRVASFDIVVDGKKADVSVIPLGGSSGGDLANVNRWRGQAGLPPVDEAGLKQTSEAIEIAGVAAELYDIATPPSDDATGILGAILHGADTVWYFKMIGDADLVKGQKANFIAFLKSLNFDQSAGGAAPAVMDASQLPAGHPPIPGMPSATQTNQ
jgi:hypothetical protein